MPPRSEDDERRERTWIEGAKAGSRDAFAQLYRLHANRLFVQILMPRLRDRAAAEDILSDTFRTALERIDAFEDQGPGLFPWLATIARNKAMDWLRARGRSGKAIDALERALRVEPQNVSAPDEELERAGLRNEVMASMEKINPRYREAIRLRVLEGNERADCAAKMNVSVGTFDVLLLRSMRAFRSSWDARPTREEG